MFHSASATDCPRLKTPLPPVLLKSLRNPNCQDSRWLHRKMSGASDKARFYLEQSVPELQELERKEVFTKVWEPAGTSRKEVR